MGAFVMETVSLIFLHFFTNNQKQKFETFSKRFIIFTLNKLKILHIPLIFILYHEYIQRVFLFSKFYVEVVYHPDEGAPL